MAPLLIGYLFNRKFGKCEKFRWFLLWLPCSLVLCFMGNLENVKNIGGTLGKSLCSLVLCFMGNVEKVKNIGGFLGGSLAHWLSVLLEMWKM